MGDQLSRNNCDAFMGLKQHQRSASHLLSHSCNTAQSIQTEGQLTWLWIKHPTSKLLTLYIGTMNVKLSLNFYQLIVNNKFLIVDNIQHSKYTSLKYRYFLFTPPPFFFKNSYLKDLNLILLNHFFSFEITY